MEGTSVTEPPDAAPQVASTVKGFDVFTLWKEYEAVAMHFNDLLIRIRTQSLAAVAAFATVAGLLLKEGSISHELRWGTLIVVFAALSIFWLAIWILDFTYYNRLLLGAVNSLMEIEKQSTQGNSVSAINLSTQIENAVALEGGAEPERRNLSQGRWWFYSLVFALLLGLMLICIWQFFAAPELPVKHMDPMRT